MAIEVVDEFDADRLAELASLYGDHDGWQHREPDAIGRAARNADLLLGLVDTRRDRLVAGARVLTDDVYYARVYDVIVARDRRHEGLGTRLVDAVVTHPRLAGVEAVTLGCRDSLVEFYEQAGLSVVDTVPGPDGEEPYRTLAADRDGQ